MSRRCYGLQRCHSEAAARKAIATGRINGLPDGLIDPVQADSKWGTQTDPTKQRGMHAHQIGAETAAGTARVATTKPVQQAAIKAVAESRLSAALQVFDVF